MPLAQKAILCVHVAGNLQPPSANHHPDVLLPEQELVLSLARGTLNHEQRQRAVALASQVTHWAGFVELIARHRLLPLVYPHLDQFLHPFLPATISEQLRVETHARMLRSLNLTHHFLRIINSLAAQGIRNLPMKGPVLAAFLYGDVSRRDFFDLDILVDREDLLRAKAVLQQLGYEPETVMSPEEEQSFFQSEAHTYDFQHTQGQFRLELHWRVEAARFHFPLANEEIWKRTQPFAFPGREVLMPEPELLLVMLCAHGAKHCWHRLRWVADVADFIARKPTIDWDKAWHTADQLRSRRMLAMGLWLAQDLLDTALPTRVQPTLTRERTARALAAQVIPRLFAPVAPQENQSERFWTSLFHCRMREHLGDGWPHVMNRIRREIAPNEKDYAFMPGNHVARWVYYFVRPFRLARDFARSRNLRNRPAHDPFRTD